MFAARKHPILVFLVHLMQLILLRKIAYMKAENAVLRSRVGKRVQTISAERALLVRLGAPPGERRIQEMLSIVHHKTFLR